MNPRPADYESAALPLSYAGPEGIIPQMARIVNKEMDNRRLEVRGLRSKNYIESDCLLIYNTESQGIEADSRR